jgi:beta-glucosidase
VAEKSIVLLKNDGDLLPLSDSGSIAVIGRLADVANTGDGGSSNTHSTHVTTALEGLRAAAGDRVRVAHDDGADPAAAAALAKDTDIALVVAGYTHDDEGEFIPPDQLAPFRDLFPEPAADEAAIAERIMHVQEGGFSPGGDRARLTLHPRDEALTEAWRDRVPAILMLWYPGMEGGHALADILFGRVNPGGRLPCVFPRRADDLPFFDRDASAITYDLWHGYRKLDRDGVSAAFPFGFGLSYTRFAYSDLQLDRSSVGSDNAVTASVDVANVGAVAGDTVVQLYVSAVGSAVERAAKELKAFARVALAAGESRQVTLRVPVAELAYRDGAAWTVEPIEYQVIVAQHADDEAALKASFAVV